MRLHTGKRRPDMERGIPLLSRHDRRLLVKCAPALFWAAFSLLLTYLLVNSWQRWADPQVDFGRELYLPWRVLYGEHPGKDYIHIYGPLSVYFNALLFKLFSPSVLTLVIANIAVFCAIGVTLYRLLRSAFGFTIAAIGTLFTTAAFSFPHYIGNGNYNYATPYAHEATHGMLLLLILLSCIRDRFDYSWRGAAVLGVIAGLISLTKFEYVLVTSILLSVRFAEYRQRTGTFPIRWAVYVATGAGAIFLVAFALLCSAMPAASAAENIFGCILGPIIYAPMMTASSNQHLLGFDDPLGNILRILKFSAGFAGCYLAILLAARIAEAAKVHRLTFVLGLVVIGGSIGLSRFLTWTHWGATFPIFLGAGAVMLAYRIVQQFRKGKIISQRTWVSGLLWFAGVGMMARMALAPKIYQYGFFQAFLAGTWICAASLHYLPPLFSATSQYRRIIFLSLFAFFAAGSTALITRSNLLYRFKSFEYGEGANLMKGYQPDRWAAHAIMEAARLYLTAQNLPAHTTLQVIPEGTTLNFMLGLKQNLKLTDVLPPTLALSRTPLVEDLKKSPPDYIVAIQRGLDEFGYPYFGYDAASGKELVDWVTVNYREISALGSSPFAKGPPGMIIYKKNVVPAGP
jgi:hypothetical protein